MIKLRSQFNECFTNLIAFQSNYLMHEKATQIEQIICLYAIYRTINTAGLCAQCASQPYLHMNEMPLNIEGNDFDRFQ